MSKNKRKIIATLTAIVLAIALVGGGTVAYFYAESGEVTNTISANYNAIELYEDVDEDGNPEQENTYEIIPGTSAVKNPTVEVTYTLDSYVYMTLEEDVGDLVEFEIDGTVWTKLPGYDNVWYTLVTADNADSSTTSGTTDVYTKKLNVLEGGIITYSADLTNEQMLENGELIDDMTMVFQAYIMQAEPFLNTNTTEAQGAEAAYLAMLGDPSAYAAAGYAAMVNGTLYTSLEEAVTAALVDGANTTIEVVAPTTVSNTLLVQMSGTGETASITLDLNGNSVTYDSGTSSNVSTYSSLIRVGEGVTLTITGDGSIDGTGMDIETELIWARGGNVIIESGTFTHSTAKESVVYASTPNGGTSVGTVEIYGGTFINNGGTYTYGSTLSALTLNVWNGVSGSSLNDAGVSSGQITVYGGTFYGNNPADGDDAGTVSTFVAEGYSVQEVTTTSGTAYVVYQSGAAATVTGLDLDNALTAAAAITADGSEVTIELGAGEYTVSSASVSNLSGATIVGSESGVTYVDVSTLSMRTSVEDVSFSNVTFTTTGNSQVFQITGSGTFTNCTFSSANASSGSSGIYYTIVSGDLVFEDCTIYGKVYGINIGEGSGNVTLKNCDITGWNSFGNTGTVTIENCTFHNSGSYGTLRFYQDATVTGCTFDSDFQWIDVNKDGVTITITDCIWTGHTDLTEILYVNGDYNDFANVIWYVDGSNVSITRGH